jgi:hypothetical protein
MVIDTSMDGDGQLCMRQAAAWLIARQQQRVAQQPFQLPRLLFLISCRKLPAGTLHAGDKARHDQQATLPK